MKDPIPAVIRFTLAIDMLQLLLCFLCLVSAVASHILDPGKVLFCSSIDGPFCPLINQQSQPPMIGLKQIAVCTFTDHVQDVQIALSVAHVQGSSSPYPATFGGGTPGGLSIPAPPSIEIYQSSLPWDGAQRATQWDHGIYSRGGMLVTDIEHQPFWQIDLGHKASVTVVEAYGIFPPSVELMLSRDSPLPWSSCSTGNPRRRQWSPDGSYSFPVGSDEECHSFEEARQAADISLAPDYCGLVSEAPIRGGRCGAAASLAVNTNPHRSLCRWCVSDHWQGDSAQYFRIQVKPDVGMIGLKFSEVVVLGGGVDSPRDVLINNIHSMNVDLKLKYQ